MAHVVNISGSDFLLEIGTGPGRKPIRHSMRHGDVAEVDDAYGMRRQPNPAADPLASIVEQMSDGKVVPASDERAATLYKAWLEKNAPARQAPQQAKGR